MFLKIEVLKKGAKNSTLFVLEIQSFRKWHNRRIEITLNNDLKNQTNNLSNLVLLKEIAPKYIKTFQDNLDYIIIKDKKPFLSFGVYNK